MLLLNFAHPLTDPQLTAIQDLAAHEIAQVIDVPSQIDPDKSLTSQIEALADAVGLSPAEWQSVPLVINPPSLNYSAVALVAELHGRMGYFPACIRLRPMPDSTPPRFEVAEIINLQRVRSAARQRR